MTAPVSLSSIIAVAGIGYSLAIGVYSLSGCYSEEDASLSRQLFDVIFVVINTIITIIAWLLFISTSGTTTPLVAALFILADAVFVVKELVTLAGIYFGEKPKASLYLKSDLYCLQRIRVIK